MPNCTVQLVINKFAKFDTRNISKKLLKRSAQKLCLEVNINTRVVLTDIGCQEFRCKDHYLDLSPQSSASCLNKNGLHGHQPRQTPLVKLLLQLS